MNKLNLFFLAYVSKAMHITISKVIFVSIDYNTSSSKLIKTVHFLWSNCSRPL